MQAGHKHPEDERLIPQSFEPFLAHRAVVFLCDKRGAGLAARSGGRIGVRPCP